MNRAERTPTARIAFGWLKRVATPPQGRESGSKQHPIIRKHQVLDDSTSVRAALVPGTSVTRYGRDWRMGQWREKSGVVFGRIGFQASGGVAEVWDDEAKDFTERELPAGTTSPFAIDLTTFRLAFQRRPGLIERGSFAGALQGLMNRAAEFDRWKVETEFRSISWREWTGTVDRVTRLEIRLDRPNPNYHGREHVEALIEGAEARMLRLIFDARPEDVDGLEIDDDFIAEAIDHAGEHGDWWATAEVQVAGKTERVQWRSEGQGDALERQVAADPRTREAPFGEIEAELRKPSSPAPEGGEQ